jgi:hypothetical protein
MVPLGGRNHRSFGSTSYAPSRRSVFGGNNPYIGRIDVRKRIISATGLAFVGLLVVTLLNGGAASATEQPACTPNDVIYSTQVNGRPDSGIFGTWAYDTFVRTTVVTNNCDGTFTLGIKDSGSFIPVIGAKSPSGGIILQAQSFADIPTGSFTGGATVTITSAVPPVDPGAVSDGKTSTSEWASLLFPNNSGELLEWGWTYTHCGETWINAKGGNSGDITGIECLTVPDYEVKLRGNDCKGSHSASATIEVKVKGSKWHATLVIPYEASDGQAGELRIEPGETKAKVVLTFAEDAGGGKVLVKVPVAEKKIRVCTDCKPPTTSTTTSPPETTTTTAISSSSSTPPASTVQDVDHNGGAGSGTSIKSEDLAYTGAPGISTLVILGALLLIAGMALLLVVLRRRGNPFRR